MKILTSINLKLVTGANFFIENGVMRNSLPFTASAWRFKGQQIKRECQY
jgi:hypothetical protein